MVKVKEDLTGKVFGRLTVLEQSEDYIDPKDRHFARWLCQCSCGSDPIVVRQSELKNNTTQSCGCLHREISRTICQKVMHKTNRYDLSGEYGIGWAANDNIEFYFDLEDYDKIRNYCWSTVEPVEGYIRIETKINNHNVNMAKLLTGINDVDHIDRNPMNNRRSNLRKATRSQQQMNRNKQSNNSSGYIGVYFNKKSNKWLASIKINKKQIHLGTFIDKQDAIKERLIAELKYFGKDFAPQRHLFEQYNIK